MAQSQPSRNVSAIGRGIMRTEASTAQSVASLVVVMDRVVQRSVVVEAFDTLVMPHHMRMNSVPSADMSTWRTVTATCDDVVECSDQNFREWEDVEAHLARLNNQHLPEHGQLPLWRLYMFLYRDTTVLFFRWHHIIGDGLSMGELWASLSTNIDLSRKHVPDVSPWAKLYLLLWVVVWSWLVVLRWFWLAFTYTRQPAAFMVGALQGTRRLAVTPEPVLPVRAFKTHRKLGTINDVVLAAVNRAVVQLTGDAETRLAVGMPVVLRFSTPRGVQLRNLIGTMSLFFPRLGAGEKFAESCVRMSAAMATLKRLPEPYVAALIMVMGNLLPRSVHRALFDTMSSKVKLAVSNVVGSTQALRVFGGTARLMMGFVPLPNNVPCAVGVLSYADNVYLSVTCDAAFGIPPRRLLNAIVRELQANLGDDNDDAAAAANE